MHKYIQCRDNVVWRDNVWRDKVAPGVYRIPSIASVVTKKCEPFVQPNNVSYTVRKIKEFPLRTNQSKGSDFFVTTFATYGIQNIQII